MNFICHFDIVRERLHILLKYINIKRQTIRELLIWHKLYSSKNINLYLAIFLN